MKLIVGLGNPGDQYKLNRHNVGFMFLDFLLKELDKEGNSVFKRDTYLGGEIALVNELILLKPQTFMNLSGRSVKTTIKRYSLSPADILVAHDDLDIPLGKCKIQIGVGPKLHNGLDSIEGVLHTPEYARIRIGVDNRQETRIPGEEYVLRNFTHEELTLLPSVFQELLRRLKSEKIL